MLTDLALLLQAAARDTSGAYGHFPGIGGRGYVWIVAEVHLMFAAFVLGVPMFAVTTELIGIVGKDEKYDKMSKEFTRLLVDRKSTRLNSSHANISYAVFCLKKNQVNVH